MSQRSVDKDRLERADREAKVANAAEREARYLKTARLREQRLAAEAKGPQASKKGRSRS